MKSQCLITLQSLIETQSNKKTYPFPSITKDTYIKIENKILFLYLLIETDFF